MLFRLIIQNFERNQVAAASLRSRFVAEYAQLQSEIQHLAWAIII